MPGPDALIGPQQDGIRGRLRIAGALLRARGARVGGTRQHRRTATPPRQAGDWSHDMIRSAPAARPGGLLVLRLEVPGSAVPERM
jgi:hypothetical protein